MKSQISYRLDSYNTLWHFLFLFVFLFFYILWNYRSVLSSLIQVVRSVLPSLIQVVRSVLSSLQQDLLTIFDQSLDAIPFYISNRLTCVLSNASFVLNGVIGSGLFYTNSTEILYVVRVFVQGSPNIDTLEVLFKSVKIS